MVSSPNRLVATVLGALFLLLAVAGFAVSSTTGFAATSGPLLLGVVQVNGLQNVTHLLLGVVLVLVGRAHVAAAKTGNSALGTVLLALGLVGVFLSGTESNILAFNGAANAVHFASAIVLLAVSLGAEKAIPSESVRAGR